MTRARVRSDGYLTATINDVAARAGVSKRTVSRVMNEQPNITADTRDRVLKAIERLGYRPNPAARRLASGKSHLVALFHSTASPPDAVVVETLGVALSRARYRLMACSSDHRLPQAAEELASLARVVPIDGAILCSPLSEHRTFELAFHAQKIPCVRIGPTTGSHGVGGNDREAAQQMMRYLASLGHCRIGFVAGPADYDTMRQRRLGFIDGAAMSGITVDPAWVVQGEDTFESGVHCGHRLLGDVRRPTAVFASTDTIAAGVMFAAGERGLSLPADLSVVGFGDEPLARQRWPTLTTVRPPLREVATSAAMLLLELLEGGATSDMSETPSAEIVVRNSSGAPCATA